ncbi:hypothetical protein [Neobacillus massiliamazoniensis]|uniref:Flagellar protein FliT n=1 Tax=Neobacillus massiliamazoniensis TaxID=1499688 RepID=A0A0U1NS91_9BACI|nr:hypothetical protein [Neobacillus massiliamazoniensis]CRK80917.1 hypothetical protein BN000_00808 [Neobacillus massiliamazoniensis]
MIDKLIRQIYEITVKMKDALQEEKYEIFEKLLNDRNVLMIQVDSIKEEQQHFEYSTFAKRLLKDMIDLDHLMAPILNDNILKAQNNLNQIKKIHLVTQKYQPYFKQTNGAFVDSKK